MPATCAKDTDFDGVPRTDTTEAATSRSSGAASSMWAAMATTFSRSVVAADWAAPPRMTALRLPPVPGPYGVSPPWRRTTSSCRTPEVVGHHLGDGGLEAVAVATAAHEDLNLAGHVDAHGGLLGSPGAETTADGSTNKLSPRPEQTALAARRRLLGPEGV